MLNILRCVLVIPVGITFALIATFPLHLVLYQTLTGSGIVEPYPQLPERLLGPAVMAIAFVWAASRTAPYRKIETAVVLFGLILLLAGAAFAVGLTGAHIGSFETTLKFGGFATAGAIVGAFIGLYIVRIERSTKVNTGLRE